VIVLTRIVFRLLADVAGLVVPSATQPTRRRIGESLGVRAGSVQGGLRHESLPAPSPA